MILDGEAAETTPTWKAFLRRAERPLYFAPPVIEIIKFGVDKSHASFINLITVSGSVLRAKWINWERRGGSSFFSSLVNLRKPNCWVTEPSLYVNNCIFFWKKKESFHRNTYGELSDWRIFSSWTF